MKRVLPFFFSIFLIVLAYFLFSGYSLPNKNDVQAVSSDEYLAKQQEISDLEKKVIELQAQTKTLSSQITYMDSQIQLTSLKIDQTEEQINSLTSKISKLEVSLDYLAEIFSKRITATYKKGDVDFTSLFFSSKGFSDFVTRYKYLKVVQRHDRALLLSMEETRTNYDDQKNEVEKLNAKLDLQKKQLDQQKKDKEYLLSMTKADEKRYQELLARARAEFEAISAILAGRGVETKIGDVSAGQRIASIIQGESCSSSGPHLHFMVVKDNNALNPFSYLKSGTDYVNCSGDSCGSANGDPFNPTGSWEWPLNPSIKFNQGFGVTWSIQHIPWLRGWYSSHNGIDINGSSSEVKAVKEGVLYKGGYFIKSKNCTLPYVRVEQSEGLSTLYLHIN